MKTIKLISIVVFLLLIMSCGGGNDKVKKTAEQFIDVFNKNDKAGINDLFPAIKTCENLSTKDIISSSGELTIEFNDKDSVYVVKLDETGKKRLILQEQSDGSYIVTESYNVFSLDTTSVNLGLKTGVPLTKLSDLEKSDLFNNDGDFIQYLCEKYPSAANGNLEREGGEYKWGRRFHDWFCEMHFGVRNNGKTTIEGEDYNVEMAIYENSTGKLKTTVTLNGVTLAPGERKDFSHEDDALYSIAYNKDLSWKVDFVLKNHTKADCLLKYSSFNGDEYDNFIKTIVR